MFVSGHDAGEEESRSVFGIRRRSLQVQESWSRIPNHANPNQVSQRFAVSKVPGETCFLQIKCSRLHDKQQKEVKGECKDRERG